MRALLTGGNGFVGRHLAEHLRQSGDEVAILDLPDDITDVAVVERTLREVRPEAIYHLAALSHVGSSWSDPSEVLRVNVIGSAVTFAVAREVVPTATTLLVSSAEVYGTVQPEQLPLDESAAPAPMSPYAASKLAAESATLAGLAEGVWPSLDAISSQWELDSEFRPADDRTFPDLFHAEWVRAVERSRSSIRQCSCNP